MGGSPGERLLIAIRAGDAAACEALLASGASPETRDGCGQAPLHLAAHFGQEEICRMLLRFGADPGAPDRDGRSPLLYAAGQGHMAICSLLLRRSSAGFGVSFAKR